MMISSKTTCFFSVNRPWPLLIFVIFSKNGFSEDSNLESNFDSPLIWRLEKKINFLKVYRFLPEKKNGVLSQYSGLNFPFHQIQIKINYVWGILWVRNENYSSNLHITTFNPWNDIMESISKCGFAFRLM